MFFLSCWFWSFARCNCLKYCCIGSTCNVLLLSTHVISDGYRTLFWRSESSHAIGMWLFVKDWTNTVVEPIPVVSVRDIPPLSSVAIFSRSNFHLVQIFADFYMLFSWKLRSAEFFTQLIFSLSSYFHLVHIFAVFIFAVFPIRENLNTVKYSTFTVIASPRIVIWRLFASNHRHYSAIITIRSMSGQD